MSQRNNAYPPQVWNESNTKVVWQPIKGTSQEFALASRADHTLYTGARGPGKTDTQIMRYRRNVGVGYGPFWRGVIFDREYKNLDDLISKSKRWFSAFGDGAKFHAGTSALKWVWKTGEELLFRVMKTEADYWDFHGQEFAYIGWNELTKYPTSALYDMTMSTNRSSFTVEKDAPWIDGEVYNRSGIIIRTIEGAKGAIRQPMKPIPLEVFSTCNPYGPGHGWVKKKFIDPAPYGRVVRKSVMAFNPATKEEEEVQITQVAIFGSYIENIYLSPKYVAELNSEKDENRRKAWLKGDWNIVAGGAFDDVWYPLSLIKKRFVIPEGWRIDRSFDWGSTHPASVGWWAEANGEEATLPDGSTFCPPAGSLIRLWEWYLTEEIGTNKGLKYSSKKIAQGIIEIETALMARGWIKTQPKPGPADNQIRNVNEEDTETIEKKMSDMGVKWTKSDKAPGSRKVGLELMRGMMESAHVGIGPGIYWMDCCKASITLVPSLTRNPKDMDDVDTTSEDHIYDETRYRVLAGSNRAARSIKVVKPT